MNKAQQAKYIIELEENGFNCKRRDNNIIYFIKSTSNINGKYNLQGSLSRTYLELYAGDFNVFLEIQQPNLSCITFRLFLIHLRFLK